MRKLKKVIYTLNVDDYSPEITEITYPLIELYANKIDAEFQVISKRKFPDWPVVYEKLQIHELGQDNDWSIYIDSDVLVHPDFFDITAHLNKDTVLHYGNDLACNRWKYDRFFLRDGRHIGSCNWFTVASDLCVDLWKPLDDLTFAEALENIYPVIFEQKQNIEAAHLIDDYVLSRNIAKYGLKFTTCKQIFNRVQPDNPGNDNYLYHQYLLPEKEKAKELKERLLNWGLHAWYNNIEAYVERNSC